MFWASKLSGRQDWLMAAILAIVVFAAGSSQMIVGVCGTYHDDGIYVSTAQAIAQGNGYRLINLPNSPVQTKYPFLYPAILAIIWKAWPSFPDNLLAMQGLSLLAGSAAIACAYLYLVRFGYCKRGGAFASCLLCAFSPYFIYFSTQTLSEIPFTLLLILSLWALDRHLRLPFMNRSSQFLLGILLALPFLCRTIGGVLVPVGLMILFWHHRPVIWVAVGSLAGILPWVFWVLIHLGGGGQDASTMYYSDYLGWWSSFGLVSIVRVFFRNLLMIMLSSMEVGLAGLSQVLLPMSFSFKFLIKLLPGLIILIAVFSQLRRGHLLPWLLIGYILVVCLWPWPPYRFALPILPFLLAYLARGMSAFLRPLSSLPTYRYAVLIGISGLVAANLVLLNNYGRVNHSTGLPSNGLSGTRVPWLSYQKVFAWITEHSKPEEVIASGLDTMAYLYTGRQSIRPFTARPTAMFYGEDKPALGTVRDLEQLFKIHNPRYLVHTPMPGFSEEKPFAELLEQVISKRPAWLKPVYVGDDERFVIFEMQSPLDHMNFKGEQIKALLPS